MCQIEEGRIKLWGNFDWLNGMPFSGPMRPFRQSFGFFDPRGVFGKRNKRPNLWLAEFVYSPNPTG